MVKHNQLNTLLMEILIVVLFFALCSTVILDVFVGAHNQSARAGAQADALTAAQSEEDYLARVEAALNEAMTLEGRTVSWEETNDEGRTLACAVELEPLGAFPRFARTVYHLAIDEGAMEGEDLLFDTGYIGEL